MRSLKILPLCALIAGCASSSAEVRPSYVSPLQYQNLSCQQLGAEAERVSRRASEVAGVQDSNKTSDAWVTGAAIVLFWPAAFFVKGDGLDAHQNGPRHTQNNGSSKCAGSSTARSLVEDLNAACADDHRCDAWLFAGGYLVRGSGELTPPATCKTCSQASQGRGTRAGQPSATSRPLLWFDPAEGLLPSRPQNLSADARSSRHGRPARQ